MSWDVDQSLTGEETHEAGRTGARRAKVWLEATTRAQAYWINPKGAPKLKFKWGNGKTFSFDLGGILRGDELDGKEFLAESKYYSKGRSQNQQYKKYLAQCYQALLAMPHRCDVFMWITWSPFMVTEWDRIRTIDFIAGCVEEFRDLIFGEGTTPATHPVLPEICEAISKRCWLIVLSHEQELLVPTVGGQEAVETFFLRSRNVD